MKHAPIIIATLTSAMMVIAAGCDSTGSQSLWDQIKNLTQDKSQLKQRVDTLETENAELSARVKTLTALGPEKRIEALSGIERIAIEKRSGLVDKDKDGKKETLVVYIRPRDDTGDTVKAPGAITLQLWDLNAPPDRALLKEWKIEPEELKKRWSGTVLTSYYRLSYKIPDLLNDQQTELTIKLTFTDYITGKTLNAQKVIKR